MQVMCETCGTIFEREGWRVRRVKHQYCSPACMGKACRADIPFSKDDLERLYEIEQHSLEAIGAMAGCSASAVRLRMNEFGIPIRQRANRARLSWQVAPQSRRDAARNRLDEWRKANPERLRSFALYAALISQTKQPSSLERAIAEQLDALDIPYAYQVIVDGKFICDFAFPDQKLIVECDGAYWHSLPQVRHSDRSKDAYLRKCGYTVLRLSEDRILSDLNGCIHDIIAHL